MKSVDETEEVGFLSSLSLSDVPEDVPDTDTMCRLCMKDCVPEIDMVQISDPNPHSSTPIAQLFIEALNIDVNHQSIEGMPRKVCIKCLTELHSFTVFKTRALSVDTKLRQIVSRKQKLAEAHALYGPDFYELDTTDTPMPQLYFDTNGEEGSDLCMPAIQATDEEVDDLLGMRETELTTGINQGAEENSQIRDDLKTIQISNRHQSVCKNIKFSKTGQKIILDFKADESMCQETKTKGQKQSAYSSPGCKESSVENVCSNVVEEVVINYAEDEYSELQNSAVCETDVQSLVSRDLERTNSCERGNAGNKVPGSESSEVLLEKPKVKKNLLRKSNLIPEVFVVESENSEKQLAYRCNSCKKSFHSRKNFRKHLSAHSDKKNIACKHCSKRFMSHSALTRHERIHSGEKPYKCQLCDRAFTQNEILQRHILTHSESKPFQCEHCDKSYTQKEGLNKHIKMHHQKVWEFIQYPCVFCDKSFCHASGLSRHMVVHTGKQIVCNFCNRPFNDSSSLRRHVKNQHVQRLS